MERAAWKRRLRRLALAARRRVRPMTTMRVGQHRIRCDVRDLYMGHDLFVYGSWEPHLMRLLPSWDLDGGVAIDVGACFGIYTLALADLVGPKGRVIALEPDPAIHELLCENVYANALSNVTTVQRFAGSEAAPAYLLRNRTNIGNGRILHHASDGAIAVTGIRIDELTEPLPPGSVRFVKIDVEGHEAEVLSGMTETFERNPGMVLQLELSSVHHDGQPLAALEALERHGFGGWEVWPHRIVPLLPGAFYQSSRFTGIINIVAGREPARLEEKLMAALESR